jgi:hypothetical protein
LEIAILNAENMPDRKGLLQYQNDLNLFTGKGKFIFVRTSKRSLLAKRSTANCSSPKVFMQEVAEHDAVRILKAMVRIASPMHTINLTKLLSLVAPFRKVSCRNHKTTIVRIYPN